MNPDKRFSFVPKLVELIVIALLDAEDVNDNVAIIEQEPAGIQRPLVVMRQDTLFFQAQPDIFKDSADLPLAVTGADNKIVRKTAPLADVQQNDIARLLIAGYLYGAAGYFNSFQSVNLLRFIFLNYTTGRKDISKFQIDWRACYN